MNNPVYGGAYACGKTERVFRYEKGELRHVCHRKPTKQCLALISNAYQGNVRWGSSSASDKPFE